MRTEACASIRGCRPVESVSRTLADSRAAVLASKGSKGVSFSVAQGAPAAAAPGTKEAAAKEAAAKEAAKLDAATGKKHSLVSGKL